MKILNFAIIIILNLLSNLRHTRKFLVIAEHFFRTFLHKFETSTKYLNNNNENEHDMEQQEQQQRNQPDGAPQEEQNEVVIEGEQPPDEPMDEDISDVEDDYEDLDIHENDVLSASSDNDTDWRSSDESSDSDIPEAGLRWTRRLPHDLRRYVMDSFQYLQDRPNYAFKPLQLIKINYILRNALGDNPTARSGHRIIASETHLYSLGGYNPRRNDTDDQEECRLFQELWSYNFATNRWKLLLDCEKANNMPEEMASNALAIHNNVLISHGGTGFPFGESCSNDCYIYTTGERPFVTRLKVTGDLPTAQYGPGIVLHEHYLYTIGGTTGYDYSCDVYRLNLLTKVWENVYICRPEMRDDPEGRYRHEVVYDGQHIYVLGGGTSLLVFGLQRIPAFNLKSNRWDHFVTLPDRTLRSTPFNTADVDDDGGYPKPRKCLSCVQHTNANGDVEAFITGGLQGDFATYFADIWKLNLRTKQWTCIRTTLPKPLYFHSAAHAGNGCMYIFGGIEYNKKDMRRRRDLYKMWMTIPKLSEICWDAVTYYNEHLNRYSRDTLLKAGIPLRFVLRVQK